MRFTTAFMTIAITLLSAQAFALGPQLSPVGPWQAGEESFEMNVRMQGRPNIGWGTNTTENQILTGAVRILSHKYITFKTHDKDYYGLTGHMRHGVTNSGNTAVSVGYFAPQMKLALQLQGEGSVWEAGPTSTVGEASTSFNIGGSLGTFGDSPTASVNAGFGESYSTPSVTIAQTTSGKTVSWNIKLPGVGFQSPGVPANPHEPSYAGYSWKFGVIFEVPKGQPLKVLVKPEIEWAFDYTRGIRNDTKVWEGSKVLAWKPISRTQPSNTSPRAGVSTGGPISAWQLPANVTLKADSGEFMGRCNGCAPNAAYPNSAFAHVSAANLRAAPWSRFQLEQLSNGKYALRADSGHYVGRCHGCIPGARYPNSLFVHVKAAALMGSPWAHFDLQRLNNGKYALQADSGHYVGRCHGCIPGARYPNSLFVHVLSAKLMNSPWAHWDIQIAR